jgi:hypothetical protein
MRSVRNPANGETTRMRDAHSKGSRRLTLPRVGIEADPVPVSRLRPRLRPARSEPARARGRPGGRRLKLELATRTRGSGGGPRAARELTRRLRAWLQSSPSGGSLLASASQRPGEAVKGTGPESVRWRLSTQRPLVVLCTRNTTRGKQAPPGAIRVDGSGTTVAESRISFLGAARAICRASP